MQTFLYVFAVLALVILLLNFLAPKTYHVSRSIDISRPPGEVFSFIRLLKNQDIWSPWAEKDPDMEKGFVGNDGEVGAISTWKGNKEVGEGEQEITRILDGELMESRLRFFKPFKSESDAYIRVEEVGAGKSRVTWGFSGAHAFPVRILMLFMNMEKAIGKDFEYGLRKLRTELENTSI